MIAASMSITAPSGSAFQSSMMRSAAVATCATIAVRVSRWKAGCTMGRWRFHSAVSAESNPSPVTSDSAEY